MRVTKELDFRDLFEECWCCDDVLNTIENHDAGDALMNLLEESFYGEVPTITEVNDLIRFDSDWIYECLGINPDDDEDDDEDDDLD